MIKNILITTLFLIFMNGCVGTVRIADKVNETTKNVISKQNNNLHDSNQTNLKK